MTTFAISPFVKRQTSDSEFSHFKGSDSELLGLIRDSFDNAKPGYRNGVVLVPVSPDQFMSSLVQLREGDKLVGQFKARREGEAPVKETRVIGDKMLAKSVDIVLYSHDVLAENNEHSCNADWEVISINANPTVGEMPISVGALMRNYLQETGGTDTKMTPEEFVEALKVSREFWRDKALVASSENKDKG